MPSVFAATSTGAFNACYLLSHWDDNGAAAVRKLKRLCRDRLSWDRFANGSFRVRLNPLELLDPRAYMSRRGFAPFRLWGDLLDVSGAVWKRESKVLTAREEVVERLAHNFDMSLLVGTDPWKETIADAIDFDKVCASERELTVATSNWRTGEVCHFVNRHGPNVIRPGVVRAAGAVPGFHEPVKLNGQRHFDGEAQIIAPLKPAIEQFHEVAVREPGPTTCTCT